MIKLYKSLKPYRLAITATILLILLQTLANLALPTLMASIVDKGIIQKNIGYIVSTGELMLLLTAAGMICSIGAAYLSSRAAVGFGRDVRMQLFSRVESFSLHELDQLGPATLITRTTNDVTQVQMVTVIILRMMVMAPILALGGIVLALQQDATLTLVLVVAVPILLLAIFLIARVAIPLFRLMQAKLDRLNLVTREGLTGVRVIRAFNRIGLQTTRFDEANTDLMNNAIRVNRLIALLMPVLMLVMNLTTVAILWFGASLINSGSMQVGSLIAFTQYAMQIMFAFLMVSMMFVMIPRAAASADRINDVLDTVPQIKDPEQPKQAEEDRGIIEFKDVTFRYPGAEQPAISNISFTAGPGETTAIIGGTGSGKSTLVNLIPRFYDVDSGSVLVDGVDTRDMSQEDLRAKIGLAPQKTVLFAGTVADNVKFGKRDASDDELAQAVEIAAAKDFIDRMGGIGAELSQGGSNLSGGQKQRISIARAVIRRPAIYIFDDSFSALDFKTEAQVRSSLRTHAGDSTVLVVAQRVATVLDADRIIVLDEGEMAGVGTHRELMDTCEIYREIVASQLSIEEAA
jgi:ATP-binding cassette, subfamily B, multidrug efflux pump